MFNYLANILTTLSLFFGFISVIFSLESHFTFAGWAIILSVIFDGLDGQVARLNPIPSGFGKELDSLVDVVSFGIAPSILGYVFLYKEFKVGAALALFAYLCCSVFRLAKYNITAKEEMQNCFIGLPTTSSGGVLASFILIFRHREGFLGELPTYVPWLFMALVLVLAFLMVSRVRYLNLDGLKNFLGRSLKLIVVILIVLFIFAAYFQKAGSLLFVYFLIYLLFSPFVVKRLNK